MNPWFIIAKILIEIDLNAKQNHLLIPIGFVRAHLILFLSNEERAITNLLDQEKKWKKPSTISEGEKTKKKKLSKSDGV